MTPAETLREIAAMVPGTFTKSTLLIAVRLIGANNTRAAHHCIATRWNVGYKSPDERAALELAIEALS